jgi:hypothetical protein
VNGIGNLRDISEGIRRRPDYQPLLLGASANWWARR